MFSSATLSAVINAGFSISTALYCTILQSFTVYVLLPPLLGLSVCCQCQSEQCHSTRLQFSQGLLRRTFRKCTRFLGTCRTFQCPQPLWILPCQSRWQLWSFQKQSAILKRTPLCPVWRSSLFSRVAFQLSQSLRPRQDTMSTDALLPLGQLDQASQRPHAQASHGECPQLCDPLPNVAARRGSWLSWLPWDTSCNKTGWPVL